MRPTSVAEFSEIYGAYASGVLDPAFALLVQTQAALKAEVAEAIARSEALAGALMEREPQAELSDDALARTLALIDDDETAGSSTVKRAALLAGQALKDLDQLPEPLQNSAIDAISAGNSWKFNAPGIRRLQLTLDSEAEAEIYRIEPGVSVPKHSHEGFEYTLCVAGAFRDETGVYGPGDLALNGPEDTHRPVADAPEVCFTLAVRGGGLKFTGMMGLVQRVLGN